LYTHSIGLVDDMGTHQEVIVKYSGWVCPVVAYTSNMRGKVYDHINVAECSPNLFPITEVEFVGGWGTNVRWRNTTFD
jgi:nitrate reductase NapE component